MSLVCKNISKAFGAVVALKDISIQVDEGEIRALLGGNGSGKSTLAKIIGGSVKRNSGTIEIQGEPYDVASPREAKDRGIIVTSQELSLFPNLSIIENLCICCVPRKGKVFADRSQMRRRAAEVLDDLQIGHLIDAEVKDLRANEQYLVEFAKAIVQNPRILIIDEITSALFNADVKIVKRKLMELKAQGCIILFISHRLPEIFDICDSVTVMRNGESVSTYRFQTDAVDEKALLSDMSGRVIVQQTVDHHATGAQAEHRAGFDVEGMRLKGFGTQIDIHAKPGTIIGIAGLQGHGQSILLRQLFGEHGPVTMKLLGEELHISSPRNSVRHGIAFISGNRETECVFPAQTIQENVDVVKNVVLKGGKNDIEALLRQYNVVYDRPTQLLTSLSGGNQQKVVISRWTSTSPKLILADDPTKGIDVQARSDFHSALCDLADSGSIVLMASSDDNELVTLAKRWPDSEIFVMYEGRIAAILRGENISEENIAAVSVGTGREEMA